MKGAPTPFAGANSSRGHFTHPKTQSDGDRSSSRATTPTVGTTDVAVETTIVVTIGDVILSS
jgi:hypothetical protein